MRLAIEPCRHIKLGCSGTRHCAHDTRVEHVLLSPGDASAFVGLWSRSGCGGLAQRLWARRAHHVCRRTGQPIILIIKTLSTHGYVFALYGYRFPLVRRTFCKGGGPVGMSTLLTQGSCKGHVVCYGNEVQYFSKFLSLIITCETSDNDMFILL